MCRLSEAEISSALARRRREGDLSDASYAAAMAALRADLRSFSVVELRAEVVSGMHELLAVHSLRAGDALQLAAAIAIRSAETARVEFVCYDDRLRKGAAPRGVVVRPRFVSP